MQRVTHRRDQDHDGSCRPRRVIESPQVKSNGFVGAVRERVCAVICTTSVEEESMVTAKSEPSRT